VWTEQELLLIIVGARSTLSCIGLEVPALTATRCGYCTEPWPGFARGSRRRLFLELSDQAKSGD